MVPESEDFFFLCQVGGGGIKVLILNFEACTYSASLRAWERGYEAMEAL